MEKKTSMLDNLVFIICFFPYVTLINTPFDTQPYALLLASILLVLRFIFNPKIKFPGIIGLYILILFYAIINSLFFSTFEESLRSLMGYISVPVFMLAAYTGVKFIKPQILSSITTVWLFFGLVQTFISRNFGSQFVSRMSTSVDRGVTGLAVEPSYYAILCIFILIFNTLFYGTGEYGKKRYYYIFVISSLQVVLSKSAMGILLYGVYLFSLFIFSESIKEKLRQLSIVVLVSIPSVFLISKLQMSESRIRSLVTKLEFGLANVVLKDGSISDRLSHVLVSFASLFHSKGIGFGVGKWNDHAVYISQNSGVVIRNISEVNFTLGRIMSGWGTVVFELGIIGIVFICGYLYLIFVNSKRISKRNNFLIYCTGLSVFILMLTSIPLTYPLFGYFMGTVLVMKKKFIIIK